ncbi:hypothetical protein BUALT_Bualt02G0087600 [Buddleja alternifolia]|uniref:Uncharacterized protein n=1 Tax=Buddleja alternifolia TaxID=168488 RepID=A0AAV6Y4Y7_9LAMI|nr:hypothetical protein BUALT_Bualt02G0087600 [Buddleja alternifolia]
MDSAEMEYWGSRNRNSVIEQAKEELEILELQHPNKFEYLKTELKAFISDFEVLLVLPNIKTHNTISTTCPSVATQESSSSRRKKRKKVIGFVEHGEASRGKVDVALQLPSETILELLNSTLPMEGKKAKTGSILRLRAARNGRYGGQQRTKPFITEKCNWIRKIIQNVVYKDILSSTM